MGSSPRRRLRSASTAAAGGKPMRQLRSACVSAGLATVLGILGVPHVPCAETPAHQPSAPYNPYPPGFLPADLDAEIARVRREVQFIFDEAVKEWKALPAPTVTGNPPTLRGSGYEAMEILGKLLNFDENMSPYRNEACAFCHMPYAAFSAPRSVTPIHRISRCSNTTRRRARSLVETSLTRARPATNCRVPMPSRRSIRRSTLRKWGFPTPPALRFGYRQRSTGRSLRRSGARISTSAGRATSSRSAPRRAGPQVSAAALHQFG